MVAIIRPVERTQVASVIAPAQATAPRGNPLQGLAAGLSDVGDALFHMEQEFAIAQAKEADTAVADKYRELLYGRESGFMYTQGGNAVANYQPTRDQLETIRSEALAGLTGTAREQAEATLDQRYQRALKSIDGHSVGQGRVYVNQRSAVRIDAAINDASVDLESAELNVSRIRGELASMGARNGWAPEVLASKQLEAVTEIHANIVDELNSTNPVAALEYLRANEGDMTGEKFSKLERALIPRAADWTGRELARDAFNSSATRDGYPRFQYGTKIEFSMGPSRPLPPNQPILDVVGRAVEDVFGQGARVVVVSGQEGDLPQHGSNRHKTGDAADVAIYRPDGSRVLATDDDAKRIALAAANRGAKGIGFGAEYMGGSHFHIDLVTPGPRQAHVWATGAKRMGSELIAAMNNNRSGSHNGTTATSAFLSILEIEDPLVRAAAIKEFKSMSSAEKSFRDQARRQASDEAFSHVEQGGAIDELPLEMRTLLGRTEMSGLRSYADKLASGSPIETDFSVLSDVYTLAETNPERFAEMDLNGYRHQLNDTDLRSLIKMQADARGSLSDDRGFATADDPEIYARLQTMLAEDDVGLLAEDPMQWIGHLTENSWKSLTKDRAKMVEAMRSETYEEARDLVEGREYVELREMAAVDPAQFANSDPEDWRSKVSESHFEKLVEMRAKILEENRTRTTTKPVAPSTVRSISKNVLAMSGINPSDDPKTAALFDGQMLAWQNQFIAAEGRQPSSEEIFGQANALLANVVIDYWPGNFNARAMEIDFGGRTLSPDDDLDPNEFKAQLLDGDVYINDQNIPPELADQVYKDLFNALGREPLPQELLNGLSALVR